jgi:hypothetical protein
MDCNHARLLLNFSRKQSELEATEAEALRSHLDTCATCSSSAKAERHLDEVVGQALRDVPVPAGLEMRLLHRLETDRVRYRWRRVATVGSLAAGLLLAVGLSWFFYFGARISPDYDRVFVDISDKERASPETVEQWFRGQGMTMEAPRQFNYGLLTSYDSAQFMNRRVPKLVFFFRGDRDNSPAIAEVYVLSNRQFRLDEVAPHPASMELITDNPDFHYVVVVNPRGSSQAFRVDRIQN